MVISGPWAALDDLFEHLVAMLSFRPWFREQQAGLS
jgi:hypothetical protein